MLLKGFKAVLLAVVLCLPLCACYGEAAEGNGVYGNGAEASVLSVEASGETAEESEAFAFDTEELADSEEDGKREELERAALELLAVDLQVIDIFANQALAPYAVGLPTESYGFRVGADYYGLDGDCLYSDFSAIEALLASAYSEDSGAPRRFLEEYPIKESPAIRSDYLGNTQICYLYDADFDTSLEGAAVTYLGERDEGVYRFQYGKGSRYYSFEMTEGECGYRLNDSLLFIAEAVLEKESTVDSAAEEVGSAVELRGECLWINVFVDNYDSVWDAESTRAVEAMVKEAGAYIEECGRAYGVEDLVLDYAWSSVEVGGYSPSYDGGVDWAIDTFKELCYDGYDGYVAELLEGKSPDNYCITFHFNRHGRSFCVPCDIYTGNNSAYHNEFCVLYYSEPEEGTYFACPALYMHEFLHNFGAVDIYKEMLTEKGEALAEVYFDKDIMRYEPVDIRNCGIGPLTAKLVGWTEYLPGHLRAFLKECI